MSKINIIIVNDINDYAMEDYHRREFENANKLFNEKKIFELIMKNKEDDIFYDNFLFTANEVINLDKREVLTREEGLKIIKKHQELFEKCMKEN